MVGLSGGTEQGFSTVADGRGRLRFEVILGNAPPTDHHDATAGIDAWQSTAEVRITGPHGRGCFDLRIAKR
jgi:hypothetical protein